MTTTFLGKYGRGQNLQGREGKGDNKMQTGDLPGPRVTLVPLGNKPAASCVLGMAMSPVNFLIIAFADRKLRASPRCHSKLTGASFEGLKKKLTGCIAQQSN
jgi:hypothetical protein